MYCYNCGNEVDNGATFCSKCGMRIMIQPTGYYYNAPEVPVVNKSKGFSIASMVLGFASTIAWFIPLFGFPVTIVGLVLGINGKKKGGKGFAITGIVLCIIFLVITSINSAIGAYNGLMGEL